MLTRFLEHLRGLRAGSHLVVHGSFGIQVRHHRSAADARLVLRHEAVVRHDVREQVGCVPEGERALRIAAATRSSGSASGSSASA